MQRGYARDYYDVEYEPELIFDQDRLTAAERHWETALNRLTPDLPEFDEVIEELRDSLAFLAEG